MAPEAPGIPHNDAPRSADRLAAVGYIDKAWQLELDVLVGGVDLVGGRHAEFAQPREHGLDDIFGRVKAAGIPYGSGPGPDKEDMHINERQGGRGVYFDELNGHSIELMTHA